MGLAPVKEYGLGKKLELSPSSIATTLGPGGGGGGGCMFSVVN